MTTKIVSGLAFAALLGGIFPSALNIQQLGVSRTIYIRADGSIDGTDRIQYTGNIYTFTSDIEGEIIVERNYIVVDGNGHTLQGSGRGKGVTLFGISNVTIRNTRIRSFECGLYLSSSSFNNVVSRNDITNNTWGIHFSYIGIRPSENRLIGNNITDNESGIVIEACNQICIVGNCIARNSLEGIVHWRGRTVISDNTITDNGIGITLEEAGSTILQNSITNNNRGLNLIGSESKIYHNNFIDNIQQLREYESIVTWNDEYPSGGNYWSDYAGVDLYAGPNQDQPGSDGVSDTPYILDENDVDNYPLMGTFCDFNITSEHHVQTVSNSTVRDCHYSGTAVTLEVMGEKSPVGFCRIYIPTALMNDSSYTVCVDSINTHHDVLPCSNPDYEYLYFVYAHTEHIDLNGDGIIDILDFGILARAIFAWPGHPRWLPEADLNSDSIINVLDLVLLMKEFVRSTYVARRIVVTATLLADLNLDGKVDMSDVNVATLAFGSHPQHVRWNARGDMDNNGIVNIKDICLIAQDFGAQ